MPVKAKPFLYYVRKTAGCWIWTGGLTWDGYGKSSTCHGDQLAHRCAWVKYVGKIPKGLWVLHTCDNPACVNPKHLFLGTTQDNTRDMDRKGRRNPPCGERCNLHKLSIFEVRRIIQLSKEGFSQKELGERFNVDRRQISRILGGKRWRIALRQSR